MRTDWTAVGPRFVLTEIHLCSELLVCVWRSVGRLRRPLRWATGNIVMTLTLAELCGFGVERRGVRRRLEAEWCAAACRLLTPGAWVAMAGASASARGRRRCRPLSLDPGKLTDTKVGPTFDCD